MIVVDTSALVAIQLNEPEADRFLEILLADEACASSPTLFEYFLVMTGRYGPEAGALALELVETLQVAVAPWTHDHADLAAEAFRRFGKGQHPARLNFGDCMAYALARSLDAPLLFKGEDFAQTDIVPALT